jgi:hypothetical protein
VIQILAIAVVACSQGMQSGNFAFQTQLKTLVVFKEGFGFFVREGSAQLEDGWATTNLAPQASSGTFMVYPLNAKDRVDTVVTTNDNRIEFSDAADIRAKLAGKIGLKMRIGSEGGVEAVGTLRNVLDDMLLLKEQSGGFKAVEYATIRTITLLDFPVRFRLATSTPNGRASIGIAYVQAGVRWEPSYLMELHGGDRARLTLRGTLLELPEELKSANLVFVIGAPNLLNVGQVDWLLQGFITRHLEDAEKPDASPGTAAPPRDADTKRAEGPAGGGGYGRAGGGEPPPVAESGELQYYTKTAFSLRPGERAMTTIFESEVAVAPFFDWNADGEHVEYVVKLKNTTGNPFTMGPVFVVEDLRPVGQAQMQYTANGGEAELRMAKAVGLKVEARQVEESRGTAPILVGDTRFLPIVMKGMLTVENFRDREAEVRIRRTAMGKVLEVLTGGAVKDTQVAANNPNSRNLIEWTLKVPAGVKLEAVYRYETYTSIGR